MKSFEYFVGLRYLRAKRKEAFVSLVGVLSMLGVVVGVMALVVVIAVMSGAETEFQRKILGLEPHLILMNKTNNFTNYEKIKAEIGNKKYIKDISPFISSQIMLKSSENVSGAFLRGVEPDCQEAMPKDFNKKNFIDMLGSDISSKNHNAKIILGDGLAKSLYVNKGDFVYAISPNATLSPFGYIPSMFKFEVAAIFKSGLYEYDSSLCYIHIKDAQKFLNMKEKVTGLSIWIDDIYKVKQVKADIEKELSFFYWTKDWMDMNKSLFAALKLEKTAMFIILILIVFVAAFNITSTLIMLVMEKTKDIAILKAMGASNKSIEKIFIIIGGLIGVVGTIAGASLGLILCVLLKKYNFVELPDVYPFSTIPIQLEFLDVFVISVVAIIICFLSAIYPAKQAAKLNTIEAIRYG